MLLSPPASEQLNLPTTSLGSQASRSDASKTQARSATRLGKGLSPGKDGNDDTLARSVPPRGTMRKANVRRPPTQISKQNACEETWQRRRSNGHAARLARTAPILTRRFTDSVLERSAKVRARAEAREASNAFDAERRAHQHLLSALDAEFLHIGFESDTFARLEKVRKIVRRKAGNLRDVLAAEWLACVLANECQRAGKVSLAVGLRGAEQSLFENGDRGAIGSCQVVESRGFCGARQRDAHFVEALGVDGSARHEGLREAFESGLQVSCGGAHSIARVGRDHLEVALETRRIFSAGCPATSAKSRRRSRTKSSACALSLAAWTERAPRKSAVSAASSAA